MLPSSRPTRPERFHHPELDGLRFCAFFAVFVHHALQMQASWWAGQGVPEALVPWIMAAVLAGGFGVDFFFCLSAYLITELLLREHRAYGSVDFRAFFVRRALRIWPLYYVFVALSAGVLPGLLPLPELSQQELLSFVFFFANWEMALHGPVPGALGPLWSVAIEEQFYLVWPTVVRLARPGRVATVAVVMVVVALATRTWLVWTGVEHPGIWCNTLARLDPIALGALTSVALGGGAPRLAEPLRKALIAAGLACPVVLSRFFPMNEAQQPALVVVYLAVGLSCAVLLVACLRSRPEGARVLAQPITVYLGRISYGLYVFHVLALIVAHEWVKPLPRVYAIVPGLALTLVFAMASYHGLEKPFLRLKTRYARVASRPE